MEAAITVLIHCLKLEMLRNLMRGSIYVQSDLNNTYIAIKRLLKEMKKVLFIGTPCQVGGLLGFIGGPQENLFTIENLKFSTHKNFIDKKPCVSIDLNIMLTMVMCNMFAVHSCFFVIFLSLSFLEKD